MKTADVLANFLACWEQPFSVAVASEMTGVSAGLVRRYLGEACDRGEVRAVGGGIWLVRRDVWMNVDGWRYSRSAAEAVLAAMGKDGVRSMRELAARMGYSRQYAFKYMEGLASIGAVEWREGMWRVVAGAELRELGTRLEKGILGRLKKEARDDSE